MKKARAARKRPRRPGLYDPEDPPLEQIRSVIYNDRLRVSSRVDLAKEILDRHVADAEADGDTERAETRSMG